MPKYVAKQDVWISHECRKVREGEEFDTTFPEVEAGGKKVPMRLGESIALVAPEKAGGKKTAAAD